MSILSTSPTNARLFDAQIAAALEDINAAVIVQQLNYWLNKDGVGTIVDGVKYVYNTFVDWVNQQFPWLSVWQFRKAMSLLRSLGIVKVIRHKARQWNQTNFYTLDCDRLAEFLNPKTAESTETKQLCVTAPQDDDNYSLEVSDPNISLYRTENTSKEKQQSSAATSFCKEEKKESDSQETEFKPAPLPASPVWKKEDTFRTKQNTAKDKSSAKVEHIVNLRWKEQIEELDSAGIPANKTLIKLLKSYEFERIESAIALFETRKREQHIPNPAGYFVSALKEGWSNENTSAVNSADIDEASVFRYWYDLARKLGYCSGQEVREDEEQWVCISGTWEKWCSAVARGYSVDYLKKILKRNQGN